MPLFKQLVAFFLLPIVFSLPKSRFRPVFHKIECLTLEEDAVLWDRYCSEHFKIIEYFYLIDNMGKWSALFGEVDGSSTYDIPKNEDVICIDKEYPGSLSIWQLQINLAERFFLDYWKLYKSSFEFQPGQVVKDAYIKFWKSVSQEYREKAAEILKKYKIPENINRDALNSLLDVRSIVFNLDFLKVSVTYSLKYKQKTIDQAKQYSRFYSDYVTFLNAGISGKPKELQKLKAYHLIKNFDLYFSKNIRQELTEEPGKNAESENTLSKILEQKSTKNNEEIAKKDSKEVKQK